MFQTEKRHDHPGTFAGRGRDGETPAEGGERRVYSYCLAGNRHQRPQLRRNAGCKRKRKRERYRDGPAKNNRSLRQLRGSSQKKTFFRAQKSERKQMALVGKPQPHPKEEGRGVARAALKHPKNIQTRLGSGRNANSQRTCTGQSQFQANAEHSLPLRNRQLNPVLARGLLTCKSVATLSSFLIHEANDD